MIKLGTVTKFNLTISGCQETHPTAGYRRWSGIASSNEPFVAFVMIEKDECISWVRSSYANNEQKIGILFSPLDQEGKKVSVSFSIGNSTVCTKGMLKSSQIEPNPIVGTFQSGTIINFADIESVGSIHLKIFFFSKFDVKMGRKGIWHLKSAHLQSLEDEWKKAFTFGRTGIIERGHSNNKKQENKNVSEVR